MCYLYHGGIVLFVLKATTANIVDPVTSFLNKKESRFIEPSIFKTPDNPNQKSFPLLSQTLHFYPRGWGGGGVLPSKE